MKLNDLSKAMTCKHDPTCAGEIKLVGLLINAGFEEAKLPTLCYLFLSFVYLLYSPYCWDSAL